MTHKDLDSEEKKQLQRKQTKEWKQKNKERVSEYNKKYNREYYQKNKEKLNNNQEYSRECYQKNKEKAKKYYQRNKEKIKEYYQKNKRKIAERDRNRLKIDQNYRLKCSLRRRTRNVLKGNRKNGKTLQLLGCTIEFLKQYLESKFLPGMTWENYGNPNGDHSDCWHIDHIKPCASFDLSDPEQQKICFHYTNLQPLWAIDNIKKGCK